MKKNPLQIRTKLKIEDEIELRVLADTMEFMNKQIEGYVGNMKASKQVKAAYYESVFSDVEPIRNKARELVEIIMKRRRR